MLFCCVVFFFFKRKPAYELRISDWSSYVFSSDLGPLQDRLGGAGAPHGDAAPHRQRLVVCALGQRDRGARRGGGEGGGDRAEGRGEASVARAAGPRSEEHRVRKECGRTCGSRGLPGTLNKT